MWNSSTYRLEKTLNYGLERVWCAAYLKVRVKKKKKTSKTVKKTRSLVLTSRRINQGSNVLALGYDEGTVVIKLGSDSPAGNQIATRALFQNDRLLNFHVGTNQFRWTIRAKYVSRPIVDQTVSFGLLTLCSNSVSRCRTLARSFGRDTTRS